MVGVDIAHPDLAEGQVGCMGIDRPDGVSFVVPEYDAMFVLGAEDDQGITA